MRINVNQWHVQESSIASPAHIDLKIFLKENQLNVYLLVKICHFSIRTLAYWLPYNFHASIDDTDQLFETLIINQ